MAEEDGGAPEESVVRLYTKRLPWTPAALIGLLFVAGGFAMTHSVSICGTRGCIAGPVAGIACIVLGAPTALIGLYYVLGPIPLLLLDHDGMLYQKSLLRVVHVRWSDVQIVRAFSLLTVNPNRHRRNLSLTVTITFTRQAVASMGGRSSLVCYFSGADLPLLPQTMVDLIRRFHPVQYLDGGEQDVTKYSPLIRPGKPSRQARWAARHPTETRQ